MLLNPKVIADLVSFATEIPNGKQNLTGLTHEDVENLNYFEKCNILN